MRIAASAVQGEDEGSRHPWLVGAGDVEQRAGAPSPAAAAAAGAAIHRQGDKLAWPARLLLLGCAGSTGGVAEACATVCTGCLDWCNSPRLPTTSAELGNHPRATSAAEGRVKALESGQLPHRCTTVICAKPTAASLCFNRLGCIKLSVPVYKPLFVSFRG